MKKLTDFINEETLNEEMYDFIRDMKGLFGRKVELREIENHLHREVTSAELRALKDAKMLATVY